MLKRLLVKNFTVFAEADFEFGPGLNVVVGTNGTGKSHVLKLGYVATKDAVDTIHIMSGFATRKEHLAVRLEGVFWPGSAEVSELIRREAVQQEAIVFFEIDDVRLAPRKLTIQPGLLTESPVEFIDSADAIELHKANYPPVFIPAKEILTLGWMLPASEQLRLPVDETYLDLLRQLNRLPFRQPPAPAILAQLTQELGGEVEAEGSRFYLASAKKKPLDMQLVAEGMRKFGTLQRLLSNGSLTPQSTLFWDEPEANLNPALLKKLAAVLTDLASQGFQIILATHSLFLLKELHVLAQQQKSKVRYFGLYSSPAGDTRVEQTDDLETLDHLAALDEELAQTARFQRVLDEDFSQPDSQLPE